MPLVLGRSFAMPSTFGVDKETQLGVESEVKIFSDYSRPKLTFSGQHKQAMFGALALTTDWLLTLL